jgi:hypothetical protein
VTAKIARFSRYLQRNSAVGLSLAVFRHSGKTQYQEGDQMTFRSLRISMFAAVTTVMLLGSAGVARAQEGPIDHLRHRTHQIVRATDRAVRGHPPVVVRVYTPHHRRHYYRVRMYDRYHHRYYYVYRRY